jgi:hypothetical protein
MKFTLLLTILAMFHGIKIAQKEIFSQKRIHAYKLPITKVEVIYTTIKTKPMTIDNVDSKFKSIDTILELNKQNEFDVLPDVRSQYKFDILPDVSSQYKFDILPDVSSQYKFEILPEVSISILKQTPDQIIADLKDLNDINFVKDTRLPETKFQIPDKKDKLNDIDEINYIQNLDNIKYFKINRDNIKEQNNVSDILTKANNKDIKVFVVNNIIAKHIIKSVNKILQEEPSDQWHSTDLIKRIDLAVREIKEKDQREFAKDAIFSIIKETPPPGGWKEDALIEAVYDRVQTKN